MNRNLFNNWKEITIGAIGLLGLGYGLAMHTKLAGIDKRLNKAVDDLSNGMEIDIPKSIVDKAIDKAAACEAKKVIEEAAANALFEVKRDIHAKVTAAVEEEYNSIKDMVLEKVTEQAAKIDVVRVRKDVEKSAHAAAMSKFNDNLDDILKTFTDNLNNTSKIYSTIANRMTYSPEPSKEVVFKVG